MPIDIATGNVELDREDFSLPGRVPIKWVRSYRTALLDQVSGDLGSGWTSNWFPTLKRSGSDWIFSDRNGSQHFFEDPNAEIAKGKTIRLLGSYLELSSNGGRFEIVSWDVDSGEIERFVFEVKTSGYAFNLVAIENVSGDRVDVTWTSGGELESLHQQRENRTILVHYKAGRISSLSLENAPGDPELVRYEYDKEGRLIAAVNRRGFAHRYEYDKLSKLKRELLPDGAVYTYKYDDKNRCIHFSGLDHYNEKRLKFLDPIGTTILTNSYGTIKTFKCNAKGQIESESSPIGAKRGTKYDEFGRVVQKIDELGAVTSYTYDEMGNRNSITDALGNVTQFTFNHAHQTTSIRDAMEQTWRREYDLSHRLIGTSNPLGAKWQIEYDQEGNPVQIIEPQGFTRKQKFNQGLLYESSDFMANKSRFKWDELGRLIERTGPVGDKTKFHYDFAGNVTQVDQPDGGSVFASYDAGDNLSSFTNAKGYATRFRYGSCERLLERTDAIGRSVRYHWDSEPDHLNTVSNEKGERFSFIRDNEGRVILERSFDGREHQFTYDAAGRCIAFINGNQERVHYKRDLLGRLIEQTLPTGEKSSYTFDPIGRTLAAINPDAEVKFEYDAAGRLIRESQNEHWVHTEYNLSDEVVRTLTSLEHEVFYELDKNGRVAKLTTANEQSLAFERDARGLEIVRSMNGNMRMEQQYDSMGRLIQQQIGKSRYSYMDATSRPTMNTIVPSFDNIRRDYAYDKGGSLQKIDDNKWGATEFNYDAAERLLGAFREIGVSESFEYDDTDNLTNLHQKNGKMECKSICYNSGNRLQMQGDTIYEHDGEGRMVRKIELARSDNPKVWEFDWDAQGQMRRLRRPDGEIWEYKYDSFGRRISKAKLAKIHKFLWNGDSVIHEIDACNKPVAWLTKRGSFAPLATVVDAQLISIVNDHLGTPCEMLSAEGVVWNSRLTCWGAEQQSQLRTAVQSCPIRFQGQWFDEESGLHYNRFRYYDADNARFLSQDPIGISAGNNIYHYVTNPISFTDPFGLTKEKNCGDSQEKPIEVTPESIASALEGSPMKTTQGAVSIPAIKAYVARLQGGETPPPIKVDGNVIVDGNHRYIAGRLFGIEPPTTPGNLPSSVPTQPIQNLKPDPVDWGNR